MLSHEGMVRFHSEKHDLTIEGSFSSLEDYCLYLLHLKAYEEAAKMAGGKSVLDIGCNTGYGTKLISKQSRETTGIDVSKKAIEEAQLRFKSAGIDFVLTDGKGLPFEDNRFDLIVSFQVLEHIVDYKTYFSEILRVLSPKGQVIFTTPNAALRLDPGMKPWNKFHVREFTTNELKELLIDFFPKVKVQGLFGGRDLYSIEYNRLSKSRERARGIPSRLLNTLPVPLVQTIKDILNKFRVKKGLSLSKIEQFSTKDLFYREDRLDKALDLMAICSMD